MTRGSVSLAGGMAAFVMMIGCATAREPQPRVFAPNRISAPDGVDCLSFTPDGNTVVFDRETKTGSTIMNSHRLGGQWSVPQIAPFSGRWVDHDPAIAPDGSYLIFTSNRPDVAGGKPLRGGHLWRVNRTGDGWTAPIRLSEIDSFGSHIYAPSMAINGDVYFISNDNRSHRFHIYRAAWRDGHFRTPVRLRLGAPGAFELDPAIAPDESFIVFDADYATKGHADRLYIAFREDGQWSQPMDLGDTVNRYQPWGSHLGPDGHTLYFTSSAAVKASDRAQAGNGGSNHIWFVDLDRWLRAQREQTMQPRIFAPGVISGPANDAAATFSPDGRTVYFFRSNGDDYDIMTSHLDHKRWSIPTIAPFSGRWRDLEPAMAPDGSYLIFASSRPVGASHKALDGHWGGQFHPGRGGNLWRVNRQGDGWSAPIRLPDIINRVDSTFSPAIAADGSLYFMAATGSGGHFQLYSSAFTGGQYHTPQLLSFSEGRFGGVDPAVAPDQSFIVFASGRPPAPPRDSYAFISFRAHGRWDDPVALGPAVNSLGGIDELRLGPDGHTLYLTSNHVIPPEYPKSLQASAAGLRRMQSWNDGNDNIWSVDLAPWLERAANVRSDQPRPSCAIDDLARRVRSAGEAHKARRPRAAAVAHPVRAIRPVILREGT